MTSPIHETAIAAALLAPPLWVLFITQTVNPILASISIGLTIAVSLVRLWPTIKPKLICLAEHLRRLGK